MRIALLFFLLIFNSCYKDNPNERIPECLESIKENMVRVIDDMDLSCLSIVWIDEYSLGDQYLYHFPAACWAPSEFVVNTDCETLTVLNNWFETEINGELFSEEAEFVRRIWEYSL